MFFKTKLLTEQILDISWKNVYYSTNPLLNSVLPLIGETCNLCNYLTHAEQRQASGLHRKENIYQKIAELLKSLETDSRLLAHHVETNGTLAMELKMVGCMDLARDKMIAYDIYFAYQFVDRSKMEDVLTRRIETLLNKGNIYHSSEITWASIENSAEIYEIFGETGPSLVCVNIRKKF